MKHFLLLVECDVYIHQKKNNFSIFLLFNNLSFTKKEYNITIISFQLLKVRLIIVLQYYYSGLNNLPLLFVCNNLNINLV